MGKASKLKKIRRIALQMPVINTHRIVGEKVSGHDVLESGVKEVEGKPVDHRLNYRKKKSIEVPLNHNKNMKRLYNKLGVNAVQGYINAVIQYQKQHDAKTD